MFYVWTYIQTCVGYSCSSSFPCLKFFGHNSFCAHVFEIGIGCISKIAFIYKNICLQKENHLWADTILNHLNCITRSNARVNFHFQAISVCQIEQIHSRIEAPQNTLTVLAWQYAIYIWICREISTTNNSRQYASGHLRLVALTFLFETHERIDTRFWQGELTGSVEEDLL
jgi:hypothetical protein